MEKDSNLNEFSKIDENVSYKERMEIMQKLKEETINQREGMKKMEKTAEELYTGNDGWEDFPQTNNWRRALEFAKQKHKGQVRDEGTPYFEHIKGVMEILIKEGNTREDEVLTVAALHDVLEDTECSYEELKDNFGSRVADAVQLLTWDWENGQTFEDYAKGKKQFHHKDI